MIQFSDASAKSLGTTRSELKKMSFVEQMDYVKRYFERKKDLLNTMMDLYLLVMKPNAVGQGKNKDYAIFDESISVPDGDGSKTSAAERMKNINKEPWVTKYGYSSNPSFMLEKEEKKKRKKWVYTRQQYEDRPGFDGGKTYIWEVEKVLREEHYDEGKLNIFNGVCEENKEKKEERKTKSKYPLWVDIAIEEEEKNIRENTHCQYIIDNYHAVTTNIQMKRCGSEKDSNRSNSAWCAAFVAYCLKTSGHKFQPDPGAIWHGKTNLVKRTKNGPEELQEHWGKKYTTMYIGGIVVWHNGGHTAIIIGIDKEDENRYIIIGGNQDNGVRYWSIPKTKIKPYCIFPIDYTGELQPLKKIEPSEIRDGAKKYSEGKTS